MSESDDVQDEIERDSVKKLIADRAIEQTGHEHEWIDFGFDALENHYQICRRCARMRPTPISEIF